MPPTPRAAIVYKATWPEEKVLRCQVSSLAKTAQENGVDRTALILVGRFLEGSYDRSRLYDPTFTTGLPPRKGRGRGMKLAILSFTATGKQLGERLCRLLTAQGHQVAASSTKAGADLHSWTAAWFTDADGLIYIGAAGHRGSGHRPPSKEQNHRPRRPLCR